MKDDRDDLWELLGRAKKPEVSPFFAANIQRHLRQQKPSPGLLDWLRAQWRIAGVAATALLIVAVTLNFSDQNPPSETEQLLAQHMDGGEDYEIISDLDELLASNETALWTENSGE